MNQDTSELTMMYLLMTTSRDLDNIRLRLFNYFTFKILIAAFILLLARPLRFVLVLLSFLAWKLVRGPNMVGKLQLQLPKQLGAFAFFGFLGTATI